MHALLAECTDKICEKICCRYISYVSHFCACARLSSLSQFWICCDCQSIAFFGYHVLQMVYFSGIEANSLHAACTRYAGKIRREKCTESSLIFQAFNASDVVQVSLFCLWCPPIPLVAVSLAQFTAVLAGIVYLRMANNQARAQNSIGVLFFMVTNQVFNPLFSVLQVSHANCLPSDLAD